MLTLCKATITHSLPGLVIKWHLCDLCKATITHSLPGLVIKWHLCDLPVVLFFRRLLPFLFFLLLPWTFYNSLESCNLLVVDENTFHILDESGDLGMYMQDSANQSAKNRKDVLHIIYK